MSLDLSPYVVTPLTETEIAAIADAIDRPIPDAALALLRTVGSPENVCHILFRDSELISRQKWLPRDLFGFAHYNDYGIDAVAMDGTVVRVIDGAAEITTVAHSVDDWLIDHALDPLRIETVSWRVQLAFATDDEGSVIAALAEMFGLRDPGSWERRGVSPAGVVTFARSCAADDGPTGIRRSEYSGWPTAHFYLDRSIPPAEIRAVKDQLGALDADRLGFKLVDYGVLPLELRP